LRAPPRPIKPTLVGFPLLAGVALLSVSTRAHAAGGHYRLELVRSDGAGSCPGAATIERDVTARLGRDPFTQTSDRGIEVVLERSESAWRARLYLRLDPNEPDAVRLLESDAADCAELGKSVTLAVALAIAPELAAEPPPEPPPPEPVCPPAPPPPAQAPLPASLHGEASLRGLLSPQSLPGASLGAALAVSVRGSLLGASFGTVFFPENELRESGARLGFGISAGFVSGCLWARTSQPQLWSCLGARLGVLHSVVYAPQPAQPGDKFWSAATSELGLRQQLFGRVFAEAGVAAIFPLVRHRFQIDAGGAPIYEQGAALVEGFVGLGLRLD
jgi:hypothetical protein